MGKEKEEDLEKGDTSANSDGDGASPLPSDETKVNGLELVNEEIGLPCPPIEFDNCTEQKQQKVLSIKKGPELNVDDEEGLPQLPGAFEVVGTEECTKRMGGLELIEDNEVGPPLPPTTTFDDSIEKKSSQHATTKKVPELISSEEDLPKPPGAYEEVGAVKFNEKIGGLELINDDDACPPISPSAAFDDSREKGNLNSPPQPLSSLAVIPRDNQDGQGRSNQENITNMSLVEKIRMNVQAIYLNRSDESVSGYTQAQMQTSNNPISNETSESDVGDIVVDVSQGDELSESEESSEMKSIPVWLRVTHAVIIVLVIAASVTTGVMLSQDNNKNNNVKPTEQELGNNDPLLDGDELSYAPSLSFVPSMLPTSSYMPSSTLSPSSIHKPSLMPSSAPSIHVQKVTDGLLLTIKMTCFPDEDVPQADIDAVAESVIAASVDDAVEQGIYNVNATVVSVFCTAEARRDLLWGNVVASFNPHHRRLATLSSALDFSVVITGDYRPPKRADGLPPEPADLNLGAIAEDSINADPEGFVKDLQERAGPTSDFATVETDDIAVEAVEIPEGTDLDRIPPFTSSPTKQPSPPPLVSQEDDGAILTICVIATAGITAILLAFLCFYKGLLRAEGGPVTEKETAWYSTGIILLVSLLLAVLVLVIFLFV